MDDGFVVRRVFKVQSVKKPAEAGLNESTLRTANERRLPNERLKVTGAMSQSALAAAKWSKLGF